MNVERTYRVAGFPLRVKASEALLRGMDNLKPFAIQAAEEAPLFRLEQVTSAPVPAGEPFFCTEDGPGFPEIAIFRQAGGYLFRVRPLPEEPVAAWLEVDDAFGAARIFLTGTADSFALNNAMMLLFAFASARKGALEMHASVVMNDGKGYLFLGKSGTGKSTHSRLWLQNIPGTELLNDDNPILRLMPDGTARVFGSPWSGKTPCYKAQDVPAGAVVRIRQAPFNAIERHKPLEAYASLMASASAFRPFREQADGWHRTLEGLVARVPSYVLDCLPDAAAARLCYETVHA
jgi:Phosphoenolpyruvate carboxykinase (ATP)